MRHKRKPYLYIMIASQIIICIIFVISALILTNNYSYHTKAMLRQGTLTTVEGRLQERVDSTIAHINTKSELTTTEVDKLIHDIGSTLSAFDRTMSHEQLLQWNETLSRLEYGAPIKFILYDKASESMMEYHLGTAKEISSEYSSVELEEYIASCPISHEVSTGAATLYILADQNCLDEVVKTHIYNVIHDSAYGENGYVWVNEIVNYEGGDDYAIRIIHPNLKDTEGIYLSTNTEDIKGNLPYLSELKGIKKNGEIFHTYYFQNKSDSKIAEKASYAKLYEPFNWIIATGEPLEDIFAYSDELIKYSNQIWHRTLVIALIVILFFFAIDILVIVISNRRYNEEIDTYVDTETKIDTLTGAFTRKAAETMLPSELGRYKDNGVPTLLMMIDIDNFKTINDTYGHDIGDRVLSKICIEIIGIIKNTDKLFRWGGDEFILLCSGVGNSQHRQISQQLLTCINDLTFNIGDDTVGISISVGSSFFHHEDVKYGEALKRADQALYHAKNSGKNKYFHWEDLQSDEAK